MTPAPAPLDLTRLALQGQFRRRAGVFCLLLLCAAAAVVSAGIGAVAIAPADVLAVLADTLGVNTGSEPSRRDRAILIGIRLPRVALALVAGAALGVAGAALQGLFRNPLADPALIGVSNGAALGAVSTIVFAGALAAALPAMLAPLLLPIGAFLAGLAVTLMVYRIGRRDGRTNMATMLLAGVAMNAVAGAGIGGLVFVSDDAQLRDLNLWLLGSLGGASLETLAPVALLTALAVALLFANARALDALLLGDDEAMHLGVPVERVKRVTIVCAALATGATVALTGVIGFVGLVVPHIARMSLGPNHRVLLPASALLGAVVMLVADIGARTLVVPAELPIGILTTLVGGPFFVWLLLANRAVRGW